MPSFIFFGLVLGICELEVEDMIPAVLNLLRFLNAVTRLSNWICWSTLIVVDPVAFSLWFLRLEIADLLPI